MPVLTKQSILDREAWESIGVKLPSFDYEALRAQTAAHPRWVHIGPGNIFRGYIAALAQKVIEDGRMAGGITAVCTFDYQIMEKIYEPCDDLTLQVVMHADGKLDKTVVASVGESIRAEKGFSAGWARLGEIFSDPGLQMVSFTITEKGYQIRNMDGNFYPDVEEDFTCDPRTDAPKNGMAIVAGLLLRRYEAGGYPIAMVSMDNFSHNGDKLFASIRAIAERWVENGLAPEGFLQYILDPGRVSFPWSMIDKITPRPDPAVAEALKESGFLSTQVVVTDKRTYIAPFVNTEVAQYLVIEDSFPNGRPELEDAGVYFASRETVDLVERMKVCTCLNPLHTAMAIFGCLLGYTSIAAEMKDPAIVKLINKIGYDEGMPVVSDPGILEPADFLREVIELRLPNPFIPDTPQRIATDTSQKLPVRYGETIKLYLQRPDLDVGSLRCIPLTIAAWCRYLMGLDDEGRPMELSADPLMDQLQTYIKDIRLGDPASAAGALRPILINPRIFGVDLYEAGLGERVEGYFCRFISGKGAVRRTLEEEVL